MTKKDFELIARVLRQFRATGEGDFAEIQWKDIVKEFGTELYKTNPRFNRYRFEVACGMD